MTPFDRFWLALFLTAVGFGFGFAASAWRRSLRRRDAALDAMIGGLASAAAYRFGSASEPREPAWAAELASAALQLVRVLRDLPEARRRPEPPWTPQLQIAVLRLERALANTPLAEAPQSSDSEPGGSGEQDL